MCASPVIGNPHVEDGNHDLDAARHGRRAQQEEHLLLVPPELPQLGRQFVELHLENLIMDELESQINCWLCLAYTDVKGWSKDE